MRRSYLITGATGTLGSAIISQLLARGARVRALVFPGDPAEETLPAEVEVCYGSVTDRDSLTGFFTGDLSSSCLIHCAGLITIASHTPADLKKVNVDGTRNVMEWCAEKQVGRVVYVSSVHIIGEKKKNEVMDESDIAAAKRLRGHYARSKFAATMLVMDAAKKGLNACVVLPSGILSPFDKGHSNISATVLSYCRGELPAAVNGGYDFVDVRDAAQGIIACCERGKAGCAYIISGHYATLRDILEYVRSLIHGKRLRYLPLWLVKILSPFFELASILKRKPMFLTPYSAHVLGSNARFSTQKAQKELGFRPRCLHATLSDMVSFFRREKLID